MWRHGNRILISCTRSFFQASWWGIVEFRIGAFREKLVTKSWQFRWQHRISSSNILGRKRVNWICLKIPSVAELWLMKRLIMFSTFWVYDTERHFSRIHSSKPSTAYFEPNSVHVKGKTFGKQVWFYFLLRIPESINDFCLSYENWDNMTILSDVWLLRENYDNMATLSDVWLPRKHRDITTIKTINTWFSEYVLRNFPGRGSIAQGISRRIFISILLPYTDYEHNEWQRCASPIGNRTLGLSFKVRPNLFMQLTILGQGWEIFHR